MNLLGTGMVVAGVPLTWALAEQGAQRSSSTWTGTLAKAIAGVSILLFIAGRFVTAN